MLTNIIYIIICIGQILIYKLGEKNPYLFIISSNVFFPLLWTQVENFKLQHIHIPIVLIHIFQMIVYVIAIDDLDMTTLISYQSLGIIFYQILTKNFHSIRILGDILIIYICCILFKFKLSIFLMILLSCCYSIELRLYQYVDTYFTSALSFTCAFFVSNFFWLYVGEVKWTSNLILQLVFYSCCQVFIQLIWSFLMDKKSGLFVLILAQFRRILVILLDFFIFHLDLRPEIFLLYGMSVFCYLSANILD